MVRSHKDATLKSGFMTSLPDLGREKRSGGATRIGHSLLDESRITSKGQITLPKTVRAVLGVSEGDIVRFRSIDGRVVVEATPDVEPGDDPAISAFLHLLEHDISTRAGAAGDFPVPLMEAMKALSAGIMVDIDARIEGEVAI